MREIEFRGKSISNIPEENGRWVYGLLWKEADFYRIGASLMLSSNIDQETIGQYTGLNDKKGTKVFDGDILRKNDGFAEYIVLIKWNDEHCGFVYDYIPPKYAPHEGIMIVSLYHFCSAEYEIIGSIYDTPELFGR
jgi:uncharacterized phage protein (TIGR01671 family)